MTMVVDASRFGMSPVTVVVSAASGNFLVPVPAGATSCIAHILGGGGNGYSVGGDLIRSGGGGEMRTGINIPLAGITQLSIQFAVAPTVSPWFSSQSTKLRAQGTGGTLLGEALHGASGQFGTGYGGTGGSGGTGRAGATGSIDVVNSFGGGAGGTLSAASGSSRGAGDTFVDTASGTAYQNGGGDQLYGGGARAISNVTTGKPGFVTLQFS